MNESDFKRYLIKSLIVQGGYGFRMEDRYAVGRPDMYLHARGIPPFLIEAKIVDGAKLTCTAIQERRLEELHKPPHAFAYIIGFKQKTRLVYIGSSEDKIEGCVWVEAPSRLTSAEWPITDLLKKALEVYHGIH